MSLITSLTEFIEQHKDFSHICLVISSELGQIEWQQHIHFDARPMVTLLSNSLKASTELFSNERQKNKVFLDIEAETSQIIAFRLALPTQIIFIFAFNQAKDIPGKFKFKVKKLALAMQEFVSKYQTSFVEGQQDLAQNGLTIFEDISDEEIDQAFSSLNL